MSLWDHNDYLEEPSDDEENQLSSSEDEVDVLLNGPAKRKRRLIREVLTGESESSSDDDFVKEMAKELDSTVREITAVWAPPPVPAINGDGNQAGASAGTGDATSATNPEFYDDIYFETSSEEESTEVGGVSTRKKKKLKKRKEASRRVLTNDELMYDPGMDDADQEWVDKQRRRYRGLQSGRADGKADEETPSSDAVLNCPACMTTLCLDCQRHELYSHQYRAMFVLNCTVNRSEVLRYRMARPRGKGKQRRRKETTGTEEAAANAGTFHAVAGGTGKEAEEEEYYPVTCNECQTEVAVFDKEEVYHFFNIIASHS
ncbi:E2F-associated phosphoprotein isoform X1 [Petromyzon marinus]|uniref:E2F-associated phosphoprotein isoform X1 n=1 Tax=Petromyzon marinus TaxID=7757 RepID=UPI003F7212EB